MADGNRLTRRAPRSRLTAARALAEPFIVVLTDWGSGRLKALDHSRHPTFEEAWSIRNRESKRGGKVGARVEESYPAPGGGVRRRIVGLEK